jgi:predicted nucleic acid-binding Zn ribbon protein
MSGDDHDPVPIADVLATVRAEYGLPESDAFVALAKRWSEVVGPEVVAHARLESVRDGTASIVADGPIWATQLRYLENEICDRANALVGADTVRSVRVRVGAS